MQLSVKLMSFSDCLNVSSPLQKSSTLNMSHQPRLQEMNSRLGNLFCFLTVRSRGRWNEAAKLCVYDHDTSTIDVSTFRKNWRIKDGKLVRFDF